MWVGRRELDVKIDIGLFKEAGIGSNTNANHAVARGGDGLV